MADDDSTAYDYQDEIDSVTRGFGRGKYGRILKMAHTPSWDEYTRTLYITGLGIVIIGAVGFVIWWIMTALPELFRGARMASIDAECEIQKVHAGAAASWPFTVNTDEQEVKITFAISTGPDGDAPEWDVMLNDTTAELWSNIRNMPYVVVPVPGKGSKILTLGVICPKGARYGDTVDVTVTVDDGVPTSETFRAKATQSIMILATKLEKEREVANDLYTKYSAFGPDDTKKEVYAVLSPAGLRGYVFVEGMNTDRLKADTRENKKTRYYVDGETSIDEIDSYLTPVSAVDGIVEGDIVMLVNGPFKGEKARVQHIDQLKEEIKVELVDAMVPIPVTVKGDSVRVIDKER